MRTPGIVAVLFLGLVCASTAQSATLSFGASKDNSLLEDANGALSGGSSFFFFVGRLGPNGGTLVRRGVMAFDLSSIPAGATVTDVTLTLSLARGRGGPIPIELHRLTKDWGEGSSLGGPQGAPSTAGGATWKHNFFNTSTWTTPGGDFVPTVSGTQDADFVGPVVWSSTPQMVADVQQWIVSPASNFGWLLKGDEVNTETAKEFNSRENSGGPLLSVTFTVPEPGTAALLGGLLLPLLTRRRWRGPR